MSPGAVNERRFVVISGLPGSGKSTLARRLSPALELKVIDKDDILEELFAAKGVGDAGWRRALSRESDLIFRERASASDGAILVSFWRQPGMPEDSGTPTGWLTEMSSRLVHVRCVCPPEIAARRFFDRHRHPGHLDSERSFAETEAQIRAIASLEPAGIGPRIDVDTTGEVELVGLVAELQKLSHRS